ncbi:hypothetical protein [Mycobacterium sp. NAZ190054]|uniref:hypothetical protein n=1 Tax=Mycobacterium sp. NAZ190054 TaxID=1747766 RepID=UPI00079245E4|nr:hypothetical protein [Mycobacterium sp. NAZ190054]KWX66988.1 hypothetical protein ASJ79_23510 [Mycobacterium sp. NAZ190054]
MSTEVTVATDLFALDQQDRAVVFYTARRHRGEPAPASLLDTLRRLRADGWRLSVDAMFTDSDEASCYDAGFAHDVDIVGVLEAPGLEAAYAGIEQLERAGWARMFRTSWQVGKREFAPVPSTAGRNPDSPWAFFALWQWNDAWQRATPAERLEYDAECDVAFSSDVNSGISIAGRHRLDVSSRWHHLGIWEVPDLALLDHAMATHERVADFKFTTSLHYIGRRRPMADVLGASL